MAGTGRSWTRAILLRLRVHPLGHEHSAEPYSPEYLYLAQQAKRLALSSTIGRLRPRNLLLFPAIIAVAVARAVDLWIANQIIRSLINERDLREQALRSQRRDG